MTEEHTLFSPITKLPRPLKYAPTQLRLTSKCTLIKVPNPGTLIKVPLETASPVARRALIFHILPIQRSRLH